MKEEFAKKFFEVVYQSNMSLVSELEKYIDNKCYKYMVKTPIKNKTYCYNGVCFNSSDFGYEKIGYKYIEFIDDNKNSVVVLIDDEEGKYIIQNVNFHSNDAKIVAEEVKKIFKIYNEKGKLSDVDGDLKNLSVIGINDENILFTNNVKLFHFHDQECCESHYLSFNDLRLDDFDGLLFDLSNDNFFKRIPGYGIELIPINGFSIKIPGYSNNNGYYSHNLGIAISKNGVCIREYDVTDCQIDIH